MELLALVGSRNKTFDISAEILAKFRLSVEIDKISPPKFRFSDFSLFFPFCYLAPKISKTKTS